MANDLLMKVLNAGHRGLLKVSGGKLGWSAGKMPVVELTTTGRKSGQKRTVMLTSPLSVGDSIVVIASKGGADTHPAWFHNLSSNPEVSVRYQGGPVETRKARVATEAEKADVWPKVVEGYEHYEGYQNKTSRDIPVVFLDKP